MQDLVAVQHAVGVYQILHTQPLDLGLLDAAFLEPAAEVGGVDPGVQVLQLLIQLEVVSRLDGGHGCLELLNRLQGRAGRRLQLESGYRPSRRGIELGAGVIEVYLCRIEGGEEAALGGAAGAAAVDAAGLDRVFLLQVLGHDGLSQLLGNSREVFRFTAGSAGDLAGLGPLVGHQAAVGLELGHAEVAQRFHLGHYCAGQGGYPLELVLAAVIAGDVVHPRILQAGHKLLDVESYHPGQYPGVLFVQGVTFGYRQGSLPVDTFGRFAEFLILRCQLYPGPAGVECLPLGGVANRPGLLQYVVGGDVGVEPAADTLLLEVGDEVQSCGELGDNLHTQADQVRVDQHLGDLVAVLLHEVAEALEA